MCPQGQGHEHGQVDGLHVASASTSTSTSTSASASASAHVVAGMDEDCLQLNIWMPAGEEEGKKDPENGAFNFL